MPKVIKSVKKSGGHSALILYGTLFESGIFWYEGYLESNIHLF
jgi:hypothetical protein